MPDLDVTIHPLSPERWDDLEDLFGPQRGASSGCWCLWPRVPASGFRTMDRDARKAAFHGIVDKGPAPGLLAYAGDLAVGWCAVGPRIDYARFQSTKVSRLDEATAADPERVFALTCFYTRTGYRKRGLMERLTVAAIAHARENGARALDVCPIEPDRPLIWGEGFVGIAPLFRAMGFEEIARRSPRRPLMRLAL